MFVTHVINLPLLSPKLIQPLGLGFHAWLYAKMSEQQSAEHYNSAKIYFSKYIVSNINNMLAEKNIGRFFNNLKSCMSCRNKFLQMASLWV